MLRFGADGEARSERAVPQELCGDALLADDRPGHEEQAPAGAVPAGDVPPLRRSEDVLPAQLALLSGHVPQSFKEQGPAVLSRRPR